MKFYNQIKKAAIEKEVEIVYKNALDKAFPNSILTHPYGCDGYIEQDIIYDEITKTLRIIMEFKCDKDLYMIPDTSNSLYKVWINDCMIYSIFENSSYQSSLRNIIISE